MKRVQSKQHIWDSSRSFLEKHEEGTFRSEQLVIKLLYKLSQIKKDILMKKQAKSKDRGLLRTMMNKQQVSYAAKRLMRDLKEIENSDTPFVGVTARPLESTMFIWHGNIRGPENTLYQGGVFHVELTFTELYPHEPPSITVFGKLEHPNVFGNTICLDLLDKTRKQIYQGWTSAYSVQSILIQLQSFLFESFPNQEEKKAKILESVKISNDYVCTSSECKHSGPLQPYPPFNKKEQNVEEFVILKDQKQLLEQETVCFHLRTPLKESALGIGVTITRLPRTGEIRQIAPTLDLVSLKAYMKDAVRHSLNNEKFTHWLPVYLGDNYDKYLYLTKKAFSMICTGSTKKFHEKQALEVMPKIIVTLVAELMNESSHTSLKALQALNNFYRLFRVFLKEYPNVEAMMNEQIEKFIKNKDQRHKDHTPNLGDLLAMVTCSDKYTIKDLMDTYTEEQLDRQVFWILKDIPELEEDKAEYDEHKSEVAFKTGIVGFHISLFFNSWNKIVIEQAGKKDNAKLCTTLDSNFGRVGDKIEEALQQECRNIREVKDFKDYYKALGLPATDDTKVLAKLKQAIKNSLEKKYHGNEEELNALPEPKELTQEIQQSYATIFKFHDEKNGTLKDAGDECWKNGLVDRFSWIKEIFNSTENQSSIKPDVLAAYSDEFEINRVVKDPYLVEKENAFHGKFKEVVEKTVSTFNAYENFTWRDLFIKLDFENYLSLFEYSPDFKTLYKYIDVCAPYLRSLKLQILNKSSLKSGHYYFMALLSKLTKLEYLMIYNNNKHNFALDGWKYLQKGFNNFKANGGSLKKIHFQNMTVYGFQQEEKIYQIMKQCPDLRSIKFRNFTISKSLAGFIGKVLSDFKFINELDLANCNLGVDPSKEIADGLMRAKQLEIIRLQGNPLAAGGDSILYNLAFSPKIKFIDMQQCSLNSSNTAEALYKLIKITGSLEILLLKNTNLINHLKCDFFKSLGENKSIKLIDFESSNSTNSSAFQSLGKAISMNSKKNGSLEYLSLTGCFNNYNDLNKFFESMEISDFDHEKWYGDSSEADKMTGAQLEKKMHSSLKYLSLDKTNINSYFNLQHYKKFTKPQWPKIIKFFTTGIESISFAHCRMQKQDAELISTCLNNPVGTCNVTALNLKKNNFRKEGGKIFAEGLKENKSLQILDLSGNAIGVSGAKAIAQSLQVNSTLKSLNLYSNKVDVDGARAFREALIKNSTLEQLDLGFNRLREKGALAIAEGITQNKTTKMKSLGFRYNFLSDDGLNTLFDQLIGSTIERLYIRNNYLSEPILHQLYDKLQQSGKRFYVDSFEKAQFLEQDRVNKAIWLSPVPPNFTVDRLKWFFQKHHECGFIKDVRIKKSAKIEGKPSDNRYVVIEFYHPNSVPKSLRVASKKLSNLDGHRFRIYRAGSRTLVYLKPTRKSKMAGQRKANVASGRDADRFRKPMRGGRR